MKPDPSDIMNHYVREVARKRAERLGEQAAPLVAMGYRLDELVIIVPDDGFPYVIPDSFTKPQ